LSELSEQQPSSALSRRIRQVGHRALLPMRVHPLWSLSVAASVCVYLGWALHFTSQLR
jgi:hypothetical protein